MVRRWHGLAVAGVAAVAVLVAALALFEGERVVVASARDGTTVAELSLGDARAFSLSYLHSVYGAPAKESFRIEGNGFRLVSISSTSAAVLDYYRLEGERKRGAKWWTLFPATTRRYERLPVIATHRGRRSLSVGGSTVPLYEPGKALHVTISVRAKPWSWAQ
jgi:hypothetical protein